MKITRIAVTHHKLPLDPPFPPAWDTRPRRGFAVTIVRVETDTGAVGIGSGDLMLGLAGHEDLFLGQDPRALERHFRIIENLSFHYGRCWPLDIALWDLAGQLAGQPCWRLLGGRGNRLALYASTGVLREPAEMAELALALQETGFRAIKLRFHRPDIRQDLAVVEAVRRSVGDGMAIMVDCNQGWRMPWDAEPPWTLKQALAVADRLAELGVEWVEEPLHRSDRQGLRTLRQACRIGIAGGEMAREMHDLRDLIAEGCLDVVQPDAVLVGGLTGLSRTVRLAQDCGVEFTPHTWGNGIGLMANAHLAAGLAGSRWLEYPFDPPSWTPERRDYPLATPLDHTGGWLTLSEQPGLGIVLDEARLAATRIG